MSLCDRECQIADAPGGKTIRRNSSCRRIDRPARRECGVQGRGTIRFDRDDLDPATKP
jgi:hypothetical protein